MVPSSNTIGRRKTIKAGLGLTSVLLAGCSGDGSNGESDGADGGSDGADGGSDGADGGSDGADGGSDGESDQWQPEDDVLLVIPYSTGGGFDFYTRTVAKHMEKYVPDDVNVGVENITGAGGRIAYNELWNTEPDGHTLSIVSVASAARRQIIYDPDYRLGELSFIAQIAQDASALCVDPATDIQNWEEFISAVESEEIIFGTAGPAGHPAVVAMALGELTGHWSAEHVLNNRVDYEEGTSGIVGSGIARGDVQAITTSFGSLLQYLESDDLRAILYLNATDELPDGVQNSDAQTLETADPPIEDNVVSRITGVTGTIRAFAGPPDMPEEIVNYWDERFYQVIHDDEFVGELEEAGRPINYADAQKSQEIAAGAQDAWEELDMIIDVIEENQ